MGRRQRNQLIRILVAIAVTIGAYFVPDIGMLKFIAFFIPYIIAGYDVLYEAFINIKNREMLDENFLMSVATIGAFAVKEYPEAVFVMVMFQIGELFEHYAVGKARKSVTQLMDIRPDYANVEIDGEIKQIDAVDVKKGDVIVVKAGERIPLDGVVVKGNTSLDTSALTGEAVPRDVCEGDEVLSGCINKSGTIYIKTNCEFGESTVSRILDMVENAAEKKTVYETFITRFARVYTPIVVAAAVFIAIVPPLIFGNFADWFYRGLIFLVVSCPCALVISVPLSFFCGIGRGSKSGILFKGSNCLEALANAHTVVFDKTGTLTMGTFSVTEINNTDCSKDDLLRYGAYAEYYSNHPVAQAVKAEYKGEVDKDLISDIKEIAGMGVSVNVGGTTVLAGNLRLMEKNGVNAFELSDGKTVVHISADGKYLGYLAVSDTVKPDGKSAVSRLKNKGIETVMLTGDSSAVAKSVGNELGIDKICSELLPQDKVFELEKVIEKRGKKETVVFAGDGINDAPVLARADIGVAMGTIGSDAAIEAADVVIMDDKPSKIADAVNISKKTMAIVKENIVFSLGVKGLVLVLSIFGLTNMWAAVFADVGVTVIAILNAMRLLLKR